MERICVFGIVQGVGFRPFVSRLAENFHINGSVCNKGSYVEIYIDADTSKSDQFITALKEEAPPRSAILKIEREPLEKQEKQFSDFSIIESTHESGDIFVSPDIGICDECTKELFDPHNRRYLHPFINCTACGPRLTILDAMPYDRERTSMGEFPMCEACEYEYTHAETRRYDAQPVCCNDCGPSVYILNGAEKDREAIIKTRQALLDGKIVAIKGIGGFHLCCNAYDENVVARLRRLKHRPTKPFALMTKDIDTAKKHCQVNDIEVKTLTGHERPIVLLKKYSNNDLAPSIAPENPNIGIMLPYAPLQLLLFTYNDDLPMVDTLVMTSANDSGAPICRTDEDALTELTNLCDLILSHNRKIRLRADDSVLSIFENNPYMIRRSRGFAPLPVMTNSKKKCTVLAIGGELKNTFCIGKNNLFYLSPYVGDMGDMRTVEALKESITRMCELLEAKPDLIVTDLHPLYNTNKLAHELGESLSLPVKAIQHHYAHILSCMAENNVSQKVIGLSFDGTGFGSDRTIWGGEVLEADNTNFQRLASITPFKQAGGDVSAKEGWRIAVSLLFSIYGKEKFAHYTEQLSLCDQQNLKGQQFMLEQNINTVTSTSAGRLFDAISAILGIKKNSTFEGEASMSLEFAAEQWYDENKNYQDKLLSIKDLEKEYLVKYSLLKQSSDFTHLNTIDLVKFIVEKKIEEYPSAPLAYFFHYLLSRMVLSICEKIKIDTQLSTVACSGGVFQNKLFLDLCKKLLTENNFKVLTHSSIPPNDGGIALGQAVYGMEVL